MIRAALAPFRFEGQARGHELATTPFADVATFAPIADTEDFARLNAELGALGGRPQLRLAAQTQALLADGLHYEERIARHGVIATRPGSSHDAFNARMWLQHCALKRAMNARQVDDIARVGTKQRTRGQCALTHFDEAGAIVWLDGADLVDAWDAHDWPALFATHRDAWGSRIALTVIGHALFDYALEHGELPVARALAVRVDRKEIARSSRHALVAAWPEAERPVADAIVAGQLLTDPQELRPLPLAGIPGWHSGADAETFYTATPCFRPLRPGRSYPEPSVLEGFRWRGGREDVARSAPVGSLEQSGR